MILQYILERSSKCCFMHLSLLKRLNTNILISIFPWLIQFHKQIAYRANGLHEYILKFDNLFLMICNGDVMIYSDIKAKIG